MMGNLPYASASPAQTGRITAWGSNGRGPAFKDEVLNLEKHVLTRFFHLFSRFFQIFKYFPLKKEGCLDLYGSSLSVSKKGV